MKKYFNILSVFLIVLVCFLTLTGCKSGVKVKDDGGDMLIQTTEERGIHLSRRNAKNDDGSYTITASFTPSYATLNQLNWNLKFSSDDSLSCSDYISLNISVDTHSCSIKLLKPFDDPIILECSSKTNNSIKASCQLDCFERSYEVFVLDIDYDSNVSDSSNDVRSIPLSENVFDFSSLTYDEIMSMNDLLSFSAAESHYIGTISTIKDYVYSISWSESIFSTCEDLGFDKASFIDTFVSITDVYDNEFNFKLFLKDMTTWDLNNNEIIEVLMNCNHWFNLNVEVKDFYNEQLISSCTSTFLLSGFNIGNIQVESVSLSDFNIIL